MANSLDATLVNTVLAQKAISKVQEKLAYIKAFTTDFSDEVRDRRSLTLNVPVLSGASAVQVNPTDFESGDTGSVNAPVTLSHISKSFYITSADLNSGTRLESLANINMQVVTNKIESMIFALMTTSNYTSALTGITAGALSVANLQTLWGAIPGDNKIAILKDTEFKNFLGTNNESYDIVRTKSGYGFDYFDRSGNGFASAGTKVVGFGCNPNAIVMAAAIPEMTSQVADLIDSQLIEVPELGLYIQSNLWGSSKTRQTWGSFDLLFGAAAADKTAGKLVVTA